ncbi:MAG: nitrous oxide reductase accessory protein NosL [Bacteroidia bacterium]
MNFVKNSFIIAAVFLMIACGPTKPEPLNFGKDGCAFCKMTIIDPKFGAEMITQKGKIFKFDAVECMINFEAKGYVKREDIAGYYVIDASGKGLITVAEADFMHSEKFPSPMGANISAFSKSPENDKIISSYNGKKLDWQQVISEISKK